jgi:purine-binding chemotaxis protein CheW
MGELVKQRAPATVADDEQLQYLTFLLGGETFAIGILNIKEIIEYGNVTTVPMMPEFVRGVINLRGAVVPVIDLAMRFSRPPSPITRRTCIVLIEVEVEGEQYNIGVTVDAVNEVLQIPGSEIESPPTFGARIRSDFIGGMGKIADKFVIILDTDKVLSVDEMATLAGTDNVAIAAADKKQSAQNEALK